MTIMGLLISLICIIFIHISMFLFLTTFSKTIKIIHQRHPKLAVLGAVSLGFWQFYYYHKYSSQLNDEELWIFEKLFVALIIFPISVIIMSFFETFTYM